MILEAKGPSYLCDEIARDEDPRYVTLNLEFSIFSFVEEDAFGAGTRILDFGCGTGASSVFLGRRFPAAEIVGVELLADSLKIAEARRRFHGLTNLRFERSPGGDKLPEGLGEFDAVVLSAVFEHLLPRERASLLPMLWKTLKPGGILFVNETPNRYFPIELHTTGLPLLNYLPRPAALLLARRFSARVDSGTSWEALLREGIRGGSVKEILARLREGGEQAAELLPIRRHGRRDDIDLWYEASLRKSGVNWRKRAFRIAAKSGRRIFGVTFAPEIVVALRKREG